MPVCTTTRETGSKYFTSLQGSVPWQYGKCKISFLPARTFFHENKLVVSQNTFSYAIKIVRPFPFQSLITGVTVSRVR
jgi:hypothetical protein